MVWVGPVAGSTTCTSLCVVLTDRARKVEGHSDAVSGVVAHSSGGSLSLSLSRTPGHEVKGKAGVLL